YEDVDYTPKQKRDDQSEEDYRAQLAREKEDVAEVRGLRVITKSTKTISNSDENEIPYLKFNKLMILSKNTKVQGWLNNLTSLNATQLSQFQQETFPSILREILTQSIAAEFTVSGQKLPIVLQDSILEISWDGMSRVVGALRMNNPLFSSMILGNLEACLEYVRENVCKIINNTKINHFITCAKNAVEFVLIRNAPNGYHDRFKDLATIVNNTHLQARVILNQGLFQEISALTPQTQIGTISDDKYGGNSTQIPPPSD